MNLDPDYIQRMTRMARMSSETSAYIKKSRTNIRSSA